LACLAFETLRILLFHSHDKRLPLIAGVFHSRALLLIGKLFDWLLKGSPPNKEIR